MIMKLANVLNIPRKLLRRLGYDVVRSSSLRTSANARRFQALRECAVDLVLDVGAAEGSFGEKLRRSGYRGRIISFEPLRESYQRLAAVASRDESWLTVNAALGSHDGDMVINVSGRSTSSSLLPMSLAHLKAAPDSRYVASESVTVKRLDTALGTMILPSDRVYLKLDVQGYEGNVLAGAVETLRAIMAVETEVSMAPMYEGSVLYAEMIQQLDDLEFQLISWEDVLTDPRTGYALQADCIFVRRS